MKNQTIKCPTCGEPIDIEHALFQKLDERIRTEYQIKLNSKLEEVDRQKKDLATERAEIEVTIDRMLKDRMESERMRIENENSSRLAAYREELERKSAELSD